jgi:hypothetical protein
MMIATALPEPERFSALGVVEIGGPEFIATRFYGTEGMNWAGEQIPQGHVL